MYGSNKQKFSTDSFLALPVDTLGDEYVVSSYTPAKRTQSLFTIVGTQQNTLISTVVPTVGNSLSIYYNRRSYTEGNSFRVRLNRFQTLQLGSRTDVTGVKVTADKPVAILAGCENSAIGGSTVDHLVEMLPPVSKWGRKFITAPIKPRNSADIIRILGKFLTRSGHP